VAHRSDDFKKWQAFLDFIENETRLYEIDFLGYPWYQSALEIANNNMFPLISYQTSTVIKEKRKKDFQEKISLLNSKYDHVFLLRAHQRRRDETQYENYFFHDLFLYLLDKNERFLIFEMPSNSDDYDAKYLQSQFADLIIPFEYLQNISHSFVAKTVIAQKKQEFHRIIEKMFYRYNNAEKFNSGYIALLKETYLRLSNNIPNIVLLQKLLKQFSAKAFWGAMMTELLSGLNNKWSIIEIEHGFRPAADIYGKAETIAQYYKNHFNFNNYYLLSMSHDKKHYRALKDNIYYYGMPELRYSGVSSEQQMNFVERHKIKDKKIFVIATSGTNANSELISLIRYLNDKIDNCVFLVRQHPFFDSPLYIDDSDNIIFVNKENLFVLLSLADIVISAPSSIVEEASLFTDKIIVYGKSDPIYNVEVYSQKYPWAKFVDLCEVELIYKTVTDLLSSPSLSMVHPSSDIKNELNNLFERIEEKAKAQSTKIKLTFVAYGPNQVNGPNVWLQRILPELAKRGVQPQVLFLMATDKPCEVAKNLEQHGIKCTTIQRQKYTEQNILQVLKALQSDPPDIFVPNLSVPAYFASRWVKEAGIPTVGILHSDDNFHHELIEYFVDGVPEYRLSGIVCVSKFIEELVKSVNNDNIEVLRSPYGINLPQNTTEEPEDRLNLVYTGRLIQRQKRIFDVIAALKDAVTSIPNTYASIYGEDREGGKVIETINNLNLGERLKYGGLLKVDEIFPALIKHHAFVLLSDYEGMSISLMEAMGSGLVPICTKTRSGVMEIIRHDENGLLVDNREADFINAVKRLRYEKGLWSRLSKAARETVERKYTIKVCADRWAGFLTNLAEQSPAKGTIHIPDINAINLPPVKISDNGICREDKRIPNTAAINSTDNFLNPQCTKENMDLYLVRSSILRALKEFLPQCKGVFLDVGCGEMPYKQLILQYAEKYIGLDIENPAYQKAVKPDIFWDGKHIPLNDNSIDCAMATELFEHLPDIETVLKEIRRVLKSGGSLFFTIPFLWPLHDMPHDEYRYTPVSLQRHLRNAGFDGIRIISLGGWDASLAQMIGLWLKRRPMSVDKRIEFIKSLFPFYNGLIKEEMQNDQLSYDEMLRQNVMVTGLTGTAIKPPGRELISAKTQLEVECPICGGIFPAFLPFGIEPRPNARCSACNSLERHRLLWLFLKTRTSFFTDKLKVLDIAPMKILSTIFKALPNIEYLSIDKSSPHAMRHMDVTSLDLLENHLDCIFCYHVLEHVPDDRKAMQEIFRVLKPGGWAILQVPIDSTLEKTLEGSHITDPKERRRLFGLEDHVRTYGLDYKQRLEEAGFVVHVDDFARTLSFDLIKRYAISERENIYYCQKPFVVTHERQVKPDNSEHRFIKSLSAEEENVEVRQVDLTANRVSGERESVLAIIVPALGIVSETFIRKHVEYLLPDKTVILTYKVVDATWVRCPVKLIPATYGGAKYSPKIAEEIVGFLRRYKVTHILSEYGAENSGIVELNRQYTKLPIFIHFHGYDASQELRKPAIVSYYRWMGFQVTGVVVVSQPMARRLINVGIPESKIKIIHYGIRPPENSVSKPEQQPCRFVCISRLVAKKGLIYLLQAFKKACSNVPDITLDIVGEGPLREKIESFIAEQGLNHAVRLHGQKPNTFVRDLLDKSCVYVQHSITDPETGDAEGLPNSILEAASQGLPVISTLHEGIPEAVQHGATGFLVEECDVEKMAEYMMMLTKDGELRRQMGLAGREKIITKGFTVDAMIQSLREYMRLSYRTGSSESTTAVNQKQVGMTSKMESKFISICIPTYNRANLIADAIDSVLAQQYLNYEIIVLDDGSTDNTANVIAGYHEPRLRYIRKEHSGAPATRNRCIAEAKGEFIVWLDSDDVLLPGTLYAYVDAINKAADVDVLYGDLIVADAYLNERRILAYKDWYGKPKELISSLISENPIPNPGVMIRKNCYEQFGNYDESFKRAHDYEFWTRIAGRATFKHIGTVVTKWRLHDSNWAGGKVKVDFSYEARVVKKILERYSLHEIYPDINWGESNNKAESAAFSRMAMQLMQWGDIDTAIQYLQKSQELFPTEQKEKRLHDLKLKSNSVMPVVKGNSSGDKDNIHKKKKKLTVTYLITSILGVTGGNQTLLNQANALIDRGHRVHIVTYTERPDYFTIKAGVIQVPRNEPMSKHIPKSDAVISTYFTNTVELTRIEAPVRIYYAQGDQFIFEDDTIRLSPEKERKKKVVKEFSKASYLYPGIKFVSNSHNLAHAVEKAYGRKADAILPVCVDSSIFHPLPKGKMDCRMRILVVGPDTLGNDMEPLIFKGIGDIREALDKLSSKRNDFVVVRMSNSQAFIFKDFKCEFHVTPNDEMKTFLYGTADILVYASHYDSCPRPPMEAMASGAAVVCTETTGALEYCRNGVNCLLVPIKSPDSLCDAIERLMDDKMLRETLVRGGFETAGQYPQKKEWDELENLLYSYYYEVVKPRSIVKGLTSVVVVLNNDKERTRECIQSIEKFTANPHEVVLITCNSKANSVKGIRNLIKGKQNYKLIEGDKNADETGRRNQGIEASSGEYILLLNNDVVVTEGWLSGMLECLKSDPDIGIVGPMTNNISGNQRVEDTGYRSMADLNVFAQSFRERNRHRRIPMRRIAGFCMLFRRELIEKIGLLDETLGTGNFEDDDFCLRAALEGYRNFIAGDVFIHHYESRSFKGNKIDYSSTMTGNRKVFKEKWSGIERKSSLGEKVLVLSALEDADTWNQKGKLDVAARMLLEGIRHAPTEKRLYYALSEMLINAKQFKDAYEILKEMSFDENDLRRLELMGYCTEGMERYNEADGYAGRALSLNLASAPALNLKGILAHKKGDNEKAQELFQKSIEADPGFSEPYTNSGVLKWAAGQREEALDLLEKGCILSPTVCDIATSYHSAISALACFERAERVFREAQALYPLNRRIAFLLIDTLIQQGKNDIAMTEIEKAMVTFGIDEGMLSAALKIRERLGPRKIEGQCSRPTLSLCMIVKNEEAYIAQCLMSVSPVIDEIIIVDTGSTDRTKEIAQAFGAQVYDFQWTYNFAEARNFSLLHAHGDWILVLDADEVISSRDHAALTDLIKKQKPVGYSFTTRNYTGNVNTEGWVPNDGNYHTEEAADGWFPSQKVRLFPGDPRIQFENHVHELVEPSLRKEKIEIEKCRIPVHHYGRLDRKRDTVKEEVYYELGKAKLQEKGDDVKAISELAVTAGTVGKYEEAIGLWQKIIAIKPDFVKAFLNLGHVYLQLQRYEDALAISKRAIELAPDQKEAVLNYATSEVHAGDVKKAISVLKDLLKEIPEYPPAIGVLAAACCIEDEKEKGLAYINKLKKLGFNCPEFLYKHARSLISAGRTHYAIRLLEAAVESNNVNDDITLLLSELQRGKGCETPA